MKWFEFNTDFFENKFVRHTYNEFGDRGVMAYIKIIALIYKEYDIEKPGKIHISWTVMRQLTNYRQKNLVTVLDFFQAERKLEWQDVNGKLFLYVPKTLERADSYTRRLLRKKYEQKDGDVHTQVRTLSGIQYNTLHNKDVNTEDVETTKERPMANLVSRSLKKLLRRERG